MATALGIAPDSSGTGTDALQLRKIIQSRWASTGIVTGLGCSGRSDLRYQLAAGVAVTQRSTADGCTEAYWQGGTTAAVATGDASNPRIDVVYLKANDPTQGDADNQVIAGVAQGTPAASPVQPSIPAGSVAVAVKRMPAGATATSSATTLTTPDYAIPYGGSMGVLMSKSYTAETSIDKGSTVTILTGSFFVPTRRTVISKILLSTAALETSYNYIGAGFIDLVFDGINIFHGSFLSWNNYGNTSFFDTMEEVEAGTHTVALKLTGAWEGPAGKVYTLYGVHSGYNWPGQQLAVVDGGVA